jgi:multicomponent Na+:H+ antiporter subunit G
MSWLVDVWVVAMVSAGVLFFVAGTVGLLRFPDSLTRLHALTKADNLGLGLVVLGLMARATGPLEALKLLGVWLVLLMASATLGPLIAERVREDEAADGKEGEPS